MFPFMGNAEAVFRYKVKFIVIPNEYEVYWLKDEWLVIRGGIVNIYILCNCEQCW